jgi:UDPglucose 6-dehydrogenase
MKVTVIGTGCVGRLTGACLAEMGKHVVCLDGDERKIHVTAHGLEYVGVGRHRAGDGAGA